MNNNPLIVALDVDTKQKALSLVNELKSCVEIFKIGPVLFTRYGPDIVIGGSGKVSLGYS